MTDEPCKSPLRDVTPELTPKQQSLINRGLLLFIIFGAALLRLYHIDQPFIADASWREADDAIIAANFFHGHLNIFLPEVSWNGPGQNYVGYEFQLITYVAALLYHLFGEADWVGRGISVVFGVWGVFAFYNLVRRAFDELRALISCAVLAVIPGAVVVDRSFIPDPVMVALVVTSFWMLLAYVQAGRTKYLGWAVITGIFGLLTKVSGLFAGPPMIYAALKAPADNSIRSKYLMRLLVAFTFVLAPVMGYYAWALHVAHAYPPYYLAARGGWVWDAGFGTFLKAHYYLRDFFHHATVRWGAPLLVLGLVGLLFPTAPSERSQRLRWLFHCWFLSGITFYALGAKELCLNPHNLHIFDPALAGLAGQGLLVAGAALARVSSPMIARAVIILFILVTPVLQKEHFREMYAPSGYTGYELGTALARVSQPSDLVITVSVWERDPIAIYYSQRRGWFFPPFWPEIAVRDGRIWGIEDESEAIQMFDRLRLDGAQWFGIVGGTGDWRDQRRRFHDTAPRLLAHIERTSELVEENSDWTIYRIRPLPK